MLVAPCTATGRLLADPVPARAEALPDAEVGRVERLLVAKYRIDLLVIRPIRWLPLALAAAVGFLLSLVSQGVYGQRAFRRDLEASPVAFPANPAGNQHR